jgi:prepilin-type processing-associated H-X9-DG protein
MSCQNNLKQLSLALLNHENAMRHFPASKIVEDQVPGTAALQFKDRIGARSWVPDVLPYLEHENEVADFDKSGDWWALKKPTGTSSAADILNGIVVQKFLAEMICPSTPVPERTQYKNDTTASNTPHKIGACGDYFPPEGVHANILADLPSAAPLGAPFPEFPSGTTSSSSIVLSGVLTPLSSATPYWLATLSGDPDADPIPADPRATVVGSRVLYSSLSSISDGTSRTIMLGECAGREDVWRNRNMVPAWTDSKTSTQCARAQGGAWATNDGPYPIGQRKSWCSAGQTSGGIPGPMKINNSNERGHLFYSFHDGGSQFAFADGSVRFLSDKIPVWVLASLVTRAGGESFSSTDLQ